MLRARLPLVLLLIVFGLVLTRESRETTVQNLDAAATAWLHKLPLRQKPSPPVTLVEINRDSLRDHPLPWTPLDFALFFQAANHFQPAVLASHEIFSWKEPAGQDSSLSKIPQYKKLLRDHLLRSGKVVLGGLLGFPEDSERLPPLQEVPLLRHSKGDPKDIPEFTDLATQPDEDFRLSSTIGFLNPPPDKALHLNIPLVWRYRGQLVPSLSLQAVILWEKATLEEVSVDIGHEIRIGDRLRIPINLRGEMLVNPHASYARCSFEDLLLTTSQKDNAPQNPPATPTNPSASIVQPELLANRLVLLARTDPESQTLSAPGLAPISLGEWNALALATVLSQSFPPPTPDWIPVLLTGISLLLALIPRSRLHPCFLVPAALVLYLGAAVITFQFSQVTLPMVLPAGLGLLLLASPWMVQDSSKTAPPSIPASPIFSKATVEPAVEPAVEPTVEPAVKPPAETPIGADSSLLDPKLLPPLKDLNSGENIPIPPLLLFPPKPVSPAASQKTPEKPAPSIPRPAFSPPMPGSAAPSSLHSDTEPRISPEESRAPDAVRPIQPDPKLPPVSNPFTLRADPPVETTRAGSEPDREDPV